MPKNIVICLDGTGNQLRAKGSTNVVKLFEMLDLSDAEKQIAYYDPGVGTFSVQGAWTPPAKWVSRVLGLAVGSGMRQNLAEVYTFLMQHWMPGDSLFIFGFSRGAYSARALAGLLHRAGLLRPGCENLVQYAVNVYARKKQEWFDDDWDEIDRFAKAFSIHVNSSPSVPIEFMGVWDSVKAAGVLRWNLRWPYTRQIPNVGQAWHAVSIDEKRRPYREYLVEAQPPFPEVNEVWFAGVHSDVGGTFEDDSKLAEIALKWIADGAIQAGLHVRPQAYKKTCTLSAEHAQGTIHRPGRIWSLMTYRHRPLTQGLRVHTSVQARMKTDENYRHRMPDAVAWEDEEWLKPRL